ncbi:MAG: hypothetical protein GY950_29020 [bacterium]|nr:hypothetical protein [bacterium]
MKEIEKLFKPGKRAIIAAESLIRRKTGERRMKPEQGKRRNPKDTEPSTTEIHQIIEEGGAFDFLNDEREDIYSDADLKVNAFKKLPLEKNIPNEETLQVMKDTDAGKNLTKWDSIDSYLSTLTIR